MTTTRPANSQLDYHLDVDGCDESGGPWTPPESCDHTAIPATDNDTRILIHQAAETLTALRAPDGHPDAGATISVLVSLAVEADDQLHDAVADARDHGYTWDQIAQRLATSTATARRRYSAYSTWRTTLDNQ
jgi:hypothetical protein